MMWEIILDDPYASDIFKAVCQGRWYMQTREAYMKRETRET